MGMLPCMIQGPFFGSPSDGTEGLSPKEVRVLCIPIFPLIVAAGVCVCACIYVYESGSCCVLQASLELKILLLLPRCCWAHMPPH